MLLGKFNKVVKFSLIILLELFICNSFAQNKRIDSLLNSLKTTIADTTKIKTINLLSSQYTNIGDYKKAMQYCDEALAVSNLEKKTTISSLEIRTIKKALSGTFNNIAIIHFQKGDYPKALEQYLKSLKIREELGEKKGIAQSHNNIGLIYLTQGDNSKALEEYTKALKIREEIGDKKGIANSLQSIGLIFHNRGENEKALEYYLKARKLFEETKNKKTTAYSNTICYIGNIYVDQANNYFKTHSGAKTIGDIKSIVDDLYKKAMIEYTNALKIKEEAGDKKGIASCYIYMSSVNIHFKKFKEAQAYLNEALNISKEIGSRETIKDSYNALATLDSASGNWRDGFEHKGFYMIYRDSIFNEASTRKTMLSQMNYEFDKKAEVLKLEQEKKDAIVSEEKQKHQIIIAFVSVGLFLVFILALVILRSLQQNKKKNKIITEQRDLVESQKIILEEQQRDVLASIHYAKRIQTALMASDKYIDKSLKKLTKND